MYSQNYQDENGNIININRLQYYISSIDLTNNTGSTIPLIDTYVLANANVSTIILEAIILVVLARLSLI